jgi:hypothetical protein
VVPSSERGGNPESAGEWMSGKRKKGKAAATLYSIGERETS